MKKLKGSLTIEAAFVLPVFLFTIFSLIYLIKIVYIHEQVQFALNEAANEMAIGAYLLENGGLLDLQQETYNEAKSNIDVTVDALGTLIDTIDGLIEFDTSFEKEESWFKSNPTEVDSSTISKLNQISKDFCSLKERIEEEVLTVYSGITNVIEAILVLTEDSKQVIVSLGVAPGMEVVNNVIGSKIAAHLVNASITNEDYLSWHIINGKNGMDYSRSSFCLNDDNLNIVVSYQIEIPFLREVLKPINMTQAVKTRAYVGNGNFIGKVEKNAILEEDETIVYITKKGVKYHTIKNCRYIDVKIKETTYNLVKDKKAICEICAKKECQLNNSTIIYTTDASDIFHTSKNCWTISRDVVSITEVEALENGYSICSKCKEEESE